MRRAGINPTQEAEFSRFVGACYERLGRFAYLMCGDWHMAEDVVQKALTKLYLVWTKNTIRSPDAYARRIVVNTLNDERRLGWFRRERVSDQLPELAGDDPGEDGARRVTVVTALAKLPPRQRSAVVLRHWEDLSIEQTAEIMGCSEGAVKSQTARGLRSLRTLLGDAVMTSGEVSS